mmetsp:Transcript_14734/g.35609  ORF Transcript_14734/g.35609 Transcript_14734/m.35609 type:complete len:252 (+) Transcript_14734:360-1115(+)
MSTTPPSAPTMGTNIAVSSSVGATRGGAVGVGGAVGGLGGGGGAWSPATASTDHASPAVVSRGVAARAASMPGPASAAADTVSTSSTRRRSVGSISTLTRNRAVVSMGRAWNASTTPKGAPPCAASAEISGGTAGVANFARTSPASAAAAAALWKSVEASLILMNDMVSATFLRASANSVARLWPDISRRVMVMEPASWFMRCTSTVSFTAIRAAASTSGATTGASDPSLGVARWKNECRCGLSVATRWGG